MLLAFTTRRMVRSAHLTLSVISFTAQFDFTVSDERHTARWAPHRIRLDVVIYVEVSSSRLPNDAVYIIID